MLPEQEAALEKARAGEGRNVEHVALETEGTLGLAATQSKTGTPPFLSAPAILQNSCLLLQQNMLLCSNDLTMAKVPCAAHSCPL
jgi:hypothetical protein